MRRSLILVPAALALLAGCSSGAKQAQTLTATSAAPASASTTAAAIPSANVSSELLAVSDLPAGWSTSTPSSSGNSLSSCAALNNGPWRKLPRHAEADFQESQDGPFLIENLATGSSSEVAQAWTAFGAATSSCRVFSGTSSNGATAHFQLQALSFPSYGDATYAFAVSISESGISASGDVIVVRKGDTVVQLLALGLGEGVPIATVEQATSAAVGHVK